MSQAKPFPLHWPEGVARTRHPIRARFKPRTYLAARKLLLAEMRRLKTVGVVLSANVPLKLNGDPYAGTHRDIDAGVAVHFIRRGKVHAIALDKYDDVGANVYALCKSVECLRAIERYGSTQLADQAFSAFAALPPAGGDRTVTRHWREVLGVPDGIDKSDQLLIAKSRFRDITKAEHPDKGGDPEKVLEAKGALSRAEEELT